MKYVNLKHYGINSENSENPGLCGAPRTTGSGDALFLKYIHLPQLGLKSTEIAQIPFFWECQLPCVGVAYLAEACGEALNALAPQHLATTARFGLICPLTT